MSIASFALFLVAPDRSRPSPACGNAVTCHIGQGCLAAGSWLSGVRPNSGLRLPSSGCGLLRTMPDHVDRHRTAIPVGQVTTVRSYSPTVPAEAGKTDVLVGLRGGRGPNGLLEAVVLGIVHE